MNLKHVFIVFKKELIDMFRDKKTIISSILIPILIFPVMYGFMGFSTKKLIKDTQEKGIEVAIKAEDNNSSIVKFLKERKELKIVDADDAVGALRKGTVKVIIFVGSGFDDAVKDGKPVPLTVQYDDTNQTSTMGEGMVREIIGQFSSEIVSQRLQEKGIDPAIINPVNIIEKKLGPQNNQDNGMGLMIFSMLLPLMLAIYSASSVLPAATDNGAGEKERGTLEPLLTTQANRLSLLMGKYFAITVAGIIGTLASMVGLFIAQKFNPEILGQGNVFSISTVIIIALATVSLTLIFAALELAVSIYARSFKEAQTYLSPITIVAMVPAFAVYMIDPKNIPIGYFNIPIVNIVCIMKELIVSIVNPLHIIIAFAWAIIYIIIAIMFARYMFTRESVVFRV
ncbi:MAG: ABC transporter permease [Clostridiales bacterium]|nr:ABC transporter permease [Clostridiales bacterium]